MMPMQQTAPMYLSNEYDDFVQSAIYVGGSGYVKDISYALWDYGGTQPANSITAVRLTFQPIDGSNDNKEVVQYFSCGQANEMVPDPTGGHLIPVGSKNAQSAQTNWAHFLKLLYQQCGLEKGRLSGPTGLKVLNGSFMTIAQGDQPHREFGDQAQGQQQGQQGQKKTPNRKMLVPVKATFPWDANYAAQAQRSGLAGGVPATPPAMMPPAMPQYAPPANGAPMVPQMAMASPAQAPAPAPVMPSNGQISAASVVSSILATQPLISVKDLLTSAINSMANVDRTTRMNVIKEIQTTLPQMAAANGWTLAGDDLMK